MFFSRVSQVEWLQNVVLDPEFWLWCKFLESNSELYNRHTIPFKEICYEPGHFASQALVSPEKCRDFALQCFYYSFYFP